MRRTSADFLTFQNAIAASLNRRFPAQLAQDDDNVGLTVGALREVERGGSGLVLLCVDLTEQVLAEAVSQRCDFIVTYSPMPHTPLRVISTEDVQGRILLICAQHSIAVHSIHTACDDASGGISEWLARSLAPGTTTPIIPHPTIPEAGRGRLLESAQAVPLSALMARLKSLLGVRYLRLALGAMVDEGNLARAQECCFVKTIAVQVGRGAALLGECTANVFITGEMAHADVIAANAQGVMVILTGQSTMERAYMHHLQQELQDEFANSDWNVKFRTSQVDSNPLSVV